MNPEPSFINVPVAGGELRVARWGDGDRVVLGIHGVTASYMSWLPVARHLGDAFTLLAPDLRGRGGSAPLPGPYGMTAHAEDMVAVLDQLGAERAVVTGQSMGAFVATVLAASHPARVERLVLVDGGLPLAVPEGLDVDAHLDATLGPAMARLRQTYPSPSAYLDFWKAHPALQDDWSRDFEAYVQYDLAGEEPALRSKVSEDAVRADARDMLANQTILHEALLHLSCPVLLLRAPRGLLNEPVALQPDALVSEWSARVPTLTEELVPDTNHYTIAMGERGAALVADRIQNAPVGASEPASSQ